MAGKLYFPIVCFLHFWCIQVVKGVKKKDNLLSRLRFKPVCTTASQACTVLRHTNHKCKMDVNFLSVWSLHVTLSNPRWGPFIDCCSTETNTGIFAGKMALFSYWRNSLGTCTYGSSGYVNSSHWLVLIFLLLHHITSNGWQLYGYIVLLPAIRTQKCFHDLTYLCTHFPKGPCVYRTSAKHSQTIINLYLSRKIWHSSRQVGEC